MTGWELLTLNDHKEWLKIVESCNQPDIHFTPKFMRLFEEKLDGEAKLFVLKNKEHDNMVIYPFFERRINNLEIFSSLDKEYYDIISPWYYGGPLLRSDKNKKSLLKLFFSTFQKFVKKNNIVSEYTRIHPLLDISKDYSTLVKGDYKYDVSYIDLTQPIKIIWNNFLKSNRNAVTASARKGVEVKFTNSKQGLKIFSNLYKDTMKRLESDEFYIFSNKFLAEFVESFKKNIIMAMATYEGEPIATSIFLFKYGFAYYWLSGYDFEHRNLYPNNLILFEAIKWTRPENRFFIFGGGNKSLRKFKESFSNTGAPHYTLNKIYNSKVYSELVLVKSQYPKKAENFFPEYRA